MRGVNTGIRWLAIALAIASLSHAASARIGLGSPGVDDATTLWQGTWETRLGVEAGGNYALQGSRLDAVRVPLSMRYGWKERLEIGFGLPFAFQTSANPLLEGSGLSDIAVALKYQMTQSEGSYPATSTELRLGYGLNNNVSSDAVSIGIVYALTKTFTEGRSAGHVNLGYTLYTAQRDDVFNWGLAYEHRMGETFRWSAGFNSGSQVVPGVRRDIMAELGLTKEMSPTLEYSLSGGAGLTKESPDWQVRLGLVKEFGSGAGSATPYRSAEWGRPPAPGAAELVNYGEDAAREGDYPLAISYYREALAKDSALPSAWNNMGLVYYKTGRYREALEAFENASKIGEPNADIFFNMGLVYYKMGDLIEARRAFARALEINPEHPHARSNLLSLEGRSTVP